MPFGGVKGSGLGRFGGKAGIARVPDLRAGSRCRRHRGHYPLEPMWLAGDPRRTAGRRRRAFERRRDGFGCFPANSGADLHVVTASLIVGSPEKPGPESPMRDRSTPHPRVRPSLSPRQCADHGSPSEAQDLATEVAAIGVFRPRAANARRMRLTSSFRLRRTSTQDAHVVGCLIAEHALAAGHDPTTRRGPRTREAPVRRQVQISQNRHRR